MEGASEVRMEATPVAALQTLEKQFMAQLQHKAAETWNYPGDAPACVSCMEGFLIACMHLCSIGQASPSSMQCPSSSFQAWVQAAGFKPLPEHLRKQQGYLEGMQLVTPGDPHLLWRCDWVEPTI